MNDRTLACYFSLVRKFEKVKSDLKHNQNLSAFNILFSLFGYSYHNPIVNHNFYHFTSEAWLLTVFRQLKEKLLLEGRMDFIKMPLNEILSYLKRISIDENLFMENLEIILGTYTLNDPVIRLAQIKLSLLFLRKLEKAKNEIVNIQALPVLTICAFEDILFFLMKKAVNYTLNELDWREEEKDSLLFLNIFTECSKDRFRRFSLENFAADIAKIKLMNDRYHNLGQSGSRGYLFENKNSEEYMELMHPCEIFYSFSTSSFLDLLQDIRNFIFHSGGIFMKLQILLNSRFSKLRCLLTFSKNFFQPILSNDRIKQMSSFFIGISKQLSRNTSHNLAIAKLSFRDLRTWLNDSYTSVTENLCEIYRIILTPKFIFEPGMKLMRVYNSKLLIQMDHITSMVKETFMKVLTDLKQNSIKLIDSEVIRFSESGLGPEFITIDLRKDFASYQVYLLMKSLRGAISTHLEYANKIKNDFFQKCRRFLGCEGFI